MPDYKRSLAYYEHTSSYYRRPIRNRIHAIHSRVVICLRLEGNQLFFKEQEIRSVERVSVQCVAFRMPKQVVIYRNLQRCKHA